MSDKKLYEQKKQAELDEWKAKVDVLKAKAAGASADAQLELNKKIKAIEGKIQKGKAKLSELAETGEDTWVSLKYGFESAWDSLKSAVSDAGSKLVNL